jgi:glycine oxidase
VRSLDEYERFVHDVRRDSGFDVDFELCGTLEIATDAESAVRLQRHLFGPGRWLDAEEARRREPCLPPSTAGAVYVGVHGYVAAPQLTEALAWAALRAGAEFEAARSAVLIEPDGDRVTVRDAEDTNWSAHQVVVASGSWAADSGIREGAARAVRPVRGQLVRLSWTGDPPQHVLWGPACYVVPWKDGTVLVGATVEDVGFDDRTTAAGVRDLLDAVCDLLPAAWGATFRDARAGLRPATADGLPIIGPSAALPGVYYATGHYRNGVLLAPITARLLGDLILDSRVDPLLQVLQPSRFPDQ